MQPKHKPENRPSKNDATIFFENLNSKSSFAEAYGRKEPGGQWPVFRMNAFNYFIDPKNANEESVTLLNIIREYLGSLHFRSQEINYLDICGQTVFDKETVTHNFSFAFDGYVKNPINNHDHFQGDIFKSTHFEQMLTYFKSHNIKLHLVAFVPVGGIKSYADTSYFLGEYGEAKSQFLFKNLFNRRLSKLRSVLETGAIVFIGTIFGFKIASQLQDSYASNPIFLRRMGYEIAYNKRGQVLLKAI